MQTSSFKVFMNLWHHILFKLLINRSCQKILEDSGLYRRHALEEGSQSLIQARSRMKFIGRRGAKVVQRGNLTWEVRSFASAY
ncbi:hypothetical protein Naga_100195g16 [Nannochloropsis gaditana]|uniref:Uncharacterized protein n=1 Tax=Nannochloropsis gaditana TaxID=72520 RepID=W7T6Y7_9STRA|nr:hypothetical protein Naga_100195g16 [Nannochloropsis gaditana]